MASGAARRKRKRENAKREAWEAYARAGGNDEAYANAVALEAAAKREEEAAKRRRADVDALNEEAGGGGERNASGAGGAGGASSVMRDAVHVPVRVFRGCAHATSVACASTSDGEAVFACGYPKRWKREHIERVVRALGFSVSEYEEIALSKAPALAACVLRVDVERESKKSKRRGGAAETFLARAEAIIDPIEAPYSSDDEEASCGGGLNAWVSAHRRKRPGSAEAVTSRIDEWFEQKEAEDAAAEEAARALRDDDGWTVVEAKRGRKKTTEESTGTTVGGIRAATADGRRREPKKVANEEFYRFQSKEKKRNEIMELQAKFEQDKLRIARLKAARKFRPL